jgi:ribosome assembly protein 1
MMGVAFVVETFELIDLPDDEEEKCRTRTQLAAQLISLSRTLFEASFLFWSPRMMLAVYRCAIQTTAEMLGKVYSALGRRHGRVLDEEYHEGTGFFTVNSLLPVAESFGFADDLRGRTAGVAIPQLMFAGFETLPEDPYWIPVTEEELEDYGSHGDGLDNLAMRHLIKIRERKGLFIERRVVQFAEKQRTLKK